MREQGGTTTTTSSTYDSADRLRQSTSDAGTLTDASDDTVTNYSYAKSDGTDTSQQRSKTVTMAGTVPSTTTYAYDVMGRMSQMTVDEGGVTTTANYAYDTSGIRVQRTEGGATTTYHIDLSNPTGYAQVLEEGADVDADGKLDAAEVSRSFTLGMQVLAQCEAGGGGGGAEPADGCEGQPRRGAES